MVLLLLLLNGPGAGSGGTSGTLALFERDIRSVAGEAWVEGITVVYRDADFFLALIDGEYGAGLPPHELLTDGSVELGNLWVGRLPPGGAIPAHLPGEVVLSRDGTVILLAGGPLEDPVLVQGIGFLGRLRSWPVGPAPGLPAPALPDGLVSDMVSAVSEDSIQALVQMLEDYDTRYMFSWQYDACADRVDTYMDDHGVPCELQTFEYAGDSMSNVVAELAGLEEPGIIYVVCGHLDSYCESNPEVLAPGADDDASGCAGVMEAARIMSGYSFRHTVRFVCFAAEEAWMVGSHYYVEQAAAAGDDIRGAVNLDMMLYAPGAQDTLYMAFDDQSAALGQLAGIVASSYVPQLPALVDYNPGEAGDHCSFWEFGYPAIVEAEASADDIWGGYNPWYHQPGDVLANYMPSFPYGTDAVRAAVAIAATLAEPLGPTSAGGGPSAPPGTVLSAWPNPSGGIVSLALEGFVSGQAAFGVFDISGRRVLEGVITASEPVTADLRGVQPGVYVIRVEAPGSPGIRLVIL